MSGCQSRITGMARAELLHGLCQCGTSENPFSTLRHRPPIHSAAARCMIPVTYRAYVADTIFLCTTWGSTKLSPQHLEFDT